MSLTFNGSSENCGCIMTVLTCEHTPWPHKSSNSLNPFSDQSIKRFAKSIEFTYNNKIVAIKQVLTRYIFEPSFRYDLHLGGYSSIHIFVVGPQAELVQGVELGSYIINQSICALHTFRQLSIYDVTDKQWMTSLINNWGCHWLEWSMVVKRHM